PVQLAEELAMLDTFTEGRLVVGLLRGTTNEYLTYDLNPLEARERTDEGMEVILKAWTEPHPFGWQGRYFQYRTVSIWPRPLQKPESRHVAGEARGPLGSGPWPTTFIGSPDTIVEQIRRCREAVGAGVLDLSLWPAGADDDDALMRSLELFGTKVLPRVRDI